MSSVFNILTEIVLILTILVTVTRQLHFLQLNSYYNTRFADYLKDQFDMISVWSLLGCVIIINMALFNIGFGLFIFTLITSLIRIGYTVFKEKNAKVKIKFTARIKRMYITSAIINVIVLLLGVFGVVSSEATIIVLSIITLLSPFFAMLVNLINSPVEKSVKQWYINDAKKILASKTDMKIIGLTGSYGKTSTKYILGRILSEKYNTVITPGNFNTPMGVVITVRNHLKPDTQVFVVEMGAKNIGDIKEICDIVHPHTGVITSIGPQHLNTFGSIENVAKTKFELADEVKSNGGKVYLNTDNQYINEKSKEYDSICYAIDDNNAQVKAKNVFCSKNGLEFDVVYKENNIHLTTKLLGSHNVLNILAAVGIALDMGINATDIKYAVESLKPTEHRLQMKSYINGATLIDDAYNANPAGSVEAMKVIGSFAPMKRIVVTPGLVELGEKEYECNKKLGVAAAENADIIILVGEKRSQPLMDGVKEHGFDSEKVFVAKSFNDAVEIFRPMCDKNTVIIFENDLPDNYEK